MKLDETVNLMCSNDFKDRFIAEYIQLVIRLSKLNITKALMLKQRDAIESYKTCLEKRAYILGIDLDNYSM